LIEKLFTHYEGNEEKKVREEAMNFRQSK